MSSQVKVDESNAIIFELYWYYFSCLFYTLCLLYSYLGVPSFDFERIWWRLLRIWWRLLRIWWRLFKKRVVRTKCFYYYHCFDTSAGGLLVSSGNIQSVVRSGEFILPRVNEIIQCLVIVFQPVVSVSTVTWFIIYFYNWNLVLNLCNYYQN
jgi:hypothetical protein